MSSKYYSTQDERVTIWNQCKLHWHLGVCPPTSISPETLEKLKVIYNDESAWVVDNGPGGRGLSWEKSCQVDDIIKQEIDK